MTSSIFESVSLHDICCFAAGVAGNLFALVLFVSPIPTFRRIMRNISTEQFSRLPYVYTLLNCLICFWYSLPFVSNGVPLVATVNSVGAIFQLFYISIFIVFGDRMTKIKISGMLIVVIGAFAAIMHCSLEYFDHDARQIFVGDMSIASLITMFASPLSIIRLVIRTKSVEFMPFYLSLATFLMSISFFGYGMLLNDFFIYIPNGVGSVLGAIQLLLYAYYNRKSRDDSRLPLLVSCK